MATIAATLTLTPDMDSEPAPDGDDAHQDRIGLSVVFSTDRDGFLRRTCPSCGRDFKTDFDEADLGTVLAPQIRRIGDEIGVSLDAEADDAPEEELTCPYCGFEEAQGEMLSEEAIRYLHRHLMREIVIPRFNRMFSDVAKSSNRSGSSGGFISISMEHTRSLLPCRPIHGPEPPDMKVLSFLCCGREAKVSKQWHRVEQCPYCRTPVTLV